MAATRLQSRYAFHVSSILHRENIKLVGRVADGAGGVWVDRLCGLQYHLLRPDFVDASMPELF